MSDAKMPQPGYNPHAVGAAPGGQPDPSNRLLGIIPDVNAGTGMALNNLGALKGNMPGGVFSDKDTGFKRQLGALGLRTRAQFEGFEAIQAPELGGGEGGQQVDHTSGLGLEDSEYEQQRQATYGSKHAHKTLHGQMPLPTEFISPMNLNPTRIGKIYGDDPDNGGGGGWGGGGGGTYEQVYGAGMTILQAGAHFMGGMPESMLTGMGSISPPATPGMGRSSEIEIG